MEPRRYKEGADRQSMPLPATLDECIDEDNIVRAIDIYVDTLDLEAMEFKYAGGQLTQGQPAYPPAALLKLYIWGNLNRTHSSRQLELETYRNLEVIWLLGGLHPCYRTICSFRVLNKKAMKSLSKDFMSLCKELDLIGKKTVGIDGAFFEGDASKQSIITKKGLTLKIKKLKSKIDKYVSEKDTNDQTDNSSLENMKKELQSCEDILKTLEETGETQYSTTDKDARLLKKPSGKGPVVGYNVQIVVDEENKLIVAHDAVNDGNDSQQLERMASKAKETMEAETIDALADGSYYNQQEIKGCIDNDIIPYVPVPKERKTSSENPHFQRSNFQYDAKIDCYVCPADALLKPKSRENKNGKEMVRYTSDAQQCASCPKKKQCLPKKTPYRQICRWEHEDIVDEHKERMNTDEGKEKIKQRAELAEHPFGTLKLWLGWTHFLLRGFEKVRAELDLLITCYNFKRVLNIIGIDAFKAYCELRYKTVQTNKEEEVLLHFYLIIAISALIFSLFWLSRALLASFIYLG